MTDPTPSILYLDQNKWIELLKAEKSPADYPKQFAILRNLRAKMDAHEIVLPLASANIYETYKIGDPERRRALAMLQSTLSGGLVFRGRHRRLEAELTMVLCDAYRLPPVKQPEWWFISDVFFEAFAEGDDGRNGLQVSDKLLALIRQHPASALFDHLTSAPNDRRLHAVRSWSDGSDALISRVERRRQQHKAETLAMRLRIYSVLMFSDEVELLARFAEKLGIHWRSVGDMGSSLVRRLVNDMPIFHTERELTVRLEAQPGSIEENDFRDVAAYCAAIPYSDVVVGENTMINLARQAGLGKKYDTRLETDLLALDI